MKRNRRRHHRQDDNHTDQIDRVYYELPLPGMLNMDELAAMQDDELIQRLTSMHEGRGRYLKARVSPRDWEVEICYIKRELQLRRERRGSHDTYVKEMEREFREDRDAERRLPAADLDNRDFMFLN